MNWRVKVADVELSAPLRNLEGLEDYCRVRCLLRWRGRPVGMIELPVTGGMCAGDAVLEAASTECHEEIFREAVRARLGTPSEDAGWDWDRLLALDPGKTGEPLPEITVAVCTRNRPASLKLCLQAMLHLEHRPLEVLVIDNAPSDDSTERIASGFPNVRHIVELRPGLDWARNRAIQEAKGEIIAFTDDDVIVDRLWTRAIGEIFAQAPEVALVTGLVAPFELETESQRMFEAYGGFGRGFRRSWARLDPADPERWRLFGTGRFGTGANMAFRRAAFERTGLFDPALDVGTATSGGGDLDMFFRVLKAGYWLVYEPAAVVRHRHRGTAGELQRQIRSNGIGLSSYFVRSALRHPRERPMFLRLARWWLTRWHLPRLWDAAFYRPVGFDRGLILAELGGSLRGLKSYQESRRQARLLGGDLVNDAVCPPEPGKSQGTGPLLAPVEITGIIPNLESGHSEVRVQLFRSGRLFGEFNLPAHDGPVSALRLKDAITDALVSRDAMAGMSEWQTQGWREIGRFFASQRKRWQAGLQGRNPTTSEAPEKVTVVVATCDRPEELRCCLDSLARQQTGRALEIIVVDNCPESKTAAAVAAQFPGVRVVEEPRPGVSYARNAGFRAAAGGIVATIDDDIMAPPDWIERLVKPLARNDVACVTGNVLPLALETEAERLFEEYGGLGRGFEALEAGGEWFDRFRRRAVPTWRLGGTANMAFRKWAVESEEIGMLDEALGPGMPSGVGEDTYFFYKILKAGWTICYEPSAWVWHKHRVTAGSLRRQIYNYSKGHVAYHLTTVLRDGDYRGLLQLMIHLPRWRLRQLVLAALGRSRTPFWMWRAEVAGNLAGPLALWRSSRRVKLLNRGERSKIAERTGSESLRAEPSTAWVQAKPAPAPVDPGL